MSDGVLQPQYADLAHQSETAELGIWGFIATEVLFLGGLFAAYSFIATCIQPGSPRRRATPRSLSAASTRRYSYAPA
jgi:heme/copper-type cytochrome/quinol oxidase subunit 3